MTEGNGGTVNAVFNVTSATPAARPSPSTSRPPTERRSRGADYTSRERHARTSPAGQLTRTITVPVTGDLLDEIDENFTVTLTNPVNAIDHRRPAASGRSPTTTRRRRCRSTTSTVAEGNAGTDGRDLHGHAERPERPRRLGRLLDAERHRDRACATTRPSSGTLNFAAGETTKQVTVLVNGDPLDESTRRSPSNLANADQRDDRRRAGPGHDQRRRSAALALDRRRHGHRGRHRHRRATFTVTLSTVSGRDGLGRLRGGQRHRHGAGRLHAAPAAR